MRWVGYIGSHMVKMLTEIGHNVTTFDNLSSGHRDAVNWGRLVVGNPVADRIDENSVVSAGTEKNY